MTEFDNDDISDTMSSFEAAVSARHLDIPDIAPRRILAALDGSTQDVAAVVLTAELASRSGAAALHLTYAYEGAPDPARDEYLARAARDLAARSAGLAVTHSRAAPAAQSSAGRSFQQILELAEREQCDVIATVAPYLDDFEQLGTASTGTTLDMLLRRRRRTPVLVVREPFSDIVRCFEHAIVPLSLLGERGPQALAWALRIVTPASGTVHLLALADTEAVEAAGPLVGTTIDASEIDERALAGLVKPEMAGLVAAAQRRAAAAGIACRVSVRLGRPIDEVMTFARGVERSMLIAGCPEHCSATGYLRVQALIRESPYPVLVA